MGWIERVLPLGGGGSAKDPKVQAYLQAALPLVERIETEYVVWREAIGAEAGRSLEGAQDPEAGHTGVFLWRTAEPVRLLAALSPPPPVRRLHNDLLQAATLRYRAAQMVKEALELAPLRDPSGALQDATSLLEDADARLALARAAASRLTTEASVQP